MRARPLTVPVAIVASILGSIVAALLSLRLPASWAAFVVILMMVAAIALVEWEQTRRIRAGQRPLRMTGERAIASWQNWATGVAAYASVVGAYSLVILVIWTASHRQHVWSQVGVGVSLIVLATYFLPMLVGRLNAALGWLMARRVTSAWLLPIRAVSLLLALLRDDTRGGGPPMRGSSAVTARERGLASELLERVLRR